MVAKEECSKMSLKWAYGQRARLTQSQGELVEALQFGHQRADGVPGLLLKSEVARVLDGLQAANTDVVLPKLVWKPPFDLAFPKLALHLWGDTSLSNETLVRQMLVEE